MLRAARRVTRLTRDGQRPDQNRCVQRLIFTPEDARGVERRETIHFDQCAALAMVIVQVANRGSVKQTPEMVEAVAIVSADGGVERHGKFSCVRLVTQL